MDDFFYQFAFSRDLKDRFARHFTFWLAAWIFQGFIYGFMYTMNDGETLFLLSFGESLIFLPQHMMLSYSIIYFVLPRYLFRGRYGLGIFFILFFITLAALLSPVMQKLLIHPY